MRLNEILKMLKSLLFMPVEVLSCLMLLKSSPPLPMLSRFPVTTTLMGLGCFPGTDPLSLGMLGMHGTYRANMAVTNCDLLIAVGARFDDRVTGDISKFAPHAQIIHVDVDPTSISKNVRVDIPIVGDAKDILKAFNALIDAKITQAQWKSNRKAWFAQIEKWTEMHSLAYTTKGYYKASICRRAIVCTHQGKCYYCN